MRQIVFRGKHAQNKEWVYGFFFTDGYNNPKILDGDRKCHIIPGTAGQYTGIEGSNGVKIFEGDIVTFPKGGNERFFVEFYDGSFYASAMNGVGKEDRSDVPGIAAYWWGDHGNGVPTIVGNIHDNQELLGGE